MMRNTMKTKIVATALAIAFASTASAKYVESFNDFSATGFDSTASTTAVNSLGKDTSITIVCEDGNFLQYINMSYVGGATGSTNTVSFKVDRNPVVMEPMIVSASGKSVSFADPTRLMDLINSVESTLSVQAKLSSNRVSSAKFQITPWHKSMFQRAYDNCQ